MAQAEMREAVRNERRVELAFEDHRWHYPPLEKLPWLYPTSSTKMQVVKFQMAHLPITGWNLSAGTTSARKCTATAHSGIPWNSENAGHAPEPRDESLMSMIKLLLSMAVQTAAMAYNQQLKNGDMLGGKNIFWVNIFLLCSLSPSANRLRPAENLP